MFPDRIVTLRILAAYASGGADVSNAPAAAPVAPYTPAKFSRDNRTVILLIGFSNLQINVCR
jgi:hypothetical protein